MHDATMQMGHTQHNNYFIIFVNEINGDLGHLRAFNATNIRYVGIFYLDPMLVEDLNNPWDFLYESKPPVQRPEGHHK